MHSHSHTHTHTHTQTRTHALTHARTHARTHKHTYARTHARTRTHTHTRTRTHTHTQAHRCAVGGSRQAELPDVRTVPGTGLPFPDCTMHSSVTHLEPCWHQRVPPARSLGQKKGVTHPELCRHQAVQPARRGVEQSRDHITHLEQCRHQAVQPARRGVEQSRDGGRGVGHSQSCPQTLQDSEGERLVHGVLVKGLAAGPLQEGGQD